MEVKTEPLSYADRATSLEGFVARAGTVQGDRPGLLLVHGGAGLDEHARQQAVRYASLGYIVLACDMFGPGIAGHRERVMAAVIGLRDSPEQLVERAQAGLQALRSQPHVDGRIGAIGFCFGGMTVLQLARSGADLAGAVSIHGSLKTARPAEPGSVRARVLVCHGALDPHVPLAETVAFAEEMNRAGADWELIMYGGAMHGFTHQHAVPGATPGVAYEPRADRRSFAATSAFLSELFTKP